MPAEWRVLIADDEPMARKGVRQLLAAFPSFKVAGECRNGAEVLAALEAIKPDVVFLDIQMPGIDGFEVIRRRTPERMPAVVFLTAHETFALKAFDAQAFDYLVKPVTQARFDRTLKRLTRQLSDGKTGPDPRIVVTTSKGVTVVPIREIDWIESADNYARIWTGGKSYLLRESLGELERRVEPHGFARAHRKAVVRLAGVRSLSSAGGELVAELESGARIEVSRRRRAGFASAVRRASGVVVAILAAALLLATPHAQQPVFKAAAIHVRVDVIATDKNDKPVTDLKASDFVITQNGAPQTIADFEYVSIPTIDRKIDLNAPQPPPPDSFTNAPPPPNARAFVFVMWGLSPYNIVPIKRMMTSFVSALQPDDEVAIVYGSRSDISQDFTNNSGKLVTAINNLRGGLGFPPIRDWVFTMHSVLRSLAASKDSRKVIVFVSEGFPSLAPPSLDVIEVFHEAVQRNIPIYTMDPRGLMAPPLGFDRHLEDQTPNGLERIRGVQAGKASLQVIAENTNGRAFVNNWNVPESAATLIGENNSFYLLGFYPNPYAVDGKFHEIDVKVKRPGVKVRARQGYTSEAPPLANAKPPQLIDNLGAAMPGGDLILQATAAPLAATPKGASTLLTVDVEYPAGSSGHDQLDLVWIAIDPDGHPRASGQNTVGADLAGRSPRVTIHDLIDLPKGQLTVRVALASRVTKTNGFVHLPMQVRDLTKNRIEVSALVVNRSPAPASQLLEIGNGLRLSPVTPSTARVFVKTERLRVLARVFFGKSAAVAGEMSLTLPNGETRSIPSTRSAGKSTDVSADFISDVVLKDLPAGQYVLTFSARNPSSKDAPAVRATSFELK